jgi:2',3'-cyclic-nucleotide 2'-phosphodiesterase (5'-nucleotidase family)
MSRMDYDIGILGNHELDHGYEAIAEFLAASLHPILCANAFGPDGNLLADGPFRIEDVDGVRVGVIGVLTEKTPEITVKRGNEGVRFESVEATLRRLVPVVRRECDLLVVLSHYGFREDLAVAGAVPGIDVIVGGHSHTEVSEPARVGNTWVAQASEYGRRVGRIDLAVDLDRKEVVGFAGRLLGPAELPPPLSKVARLVASFEDRVSGLVDVTIGTSDRELTRQDLKPLIEAIYLERCGGDFAFQNLGGVRAGLSKGPITKRQVWTVLPFDNTLVKVRLQGSGIGGAFWEEIAAREMARLEEREYTIVTNSFVAEHSEQFFGVPDLAFEETGLAMRDVVVDHVVAAGTIEVSVARSGSR